MKPLHVVTFTREGGRDIWALRASQIPRGMLFWLLIEDVPCLWFVGDPRDERHYEIVVLQRWIIERRRAYLKATRTPGERPGEFPDGWIELLRRVREMKGKIRSKNFTLEKFPGA